MWQNCRAQEVAKFVCRVLFRVLGKTEQNQSEQGQNWTAPGFWAGGVCVCIFLCVYVAFVNAKKNKGASQASVYVHKSAYVNSSLHWWFPSGFFSKSLSCLCDCHRYWMCETGRRAGLKVCEAFWLLCLSSWVESVCTLMFACVEHWVCVRVCLCVVAVNVWNRAESESKIVCPPERLWCVCLSLLMLNVWKLVESASLYFCVCDSRWRIGRQDGAGDDEWGDRQRRIALYPSVTIPLSLSLSSLSPPVGMMQCLLFSRLEEEMEGGKMGRRRKEKNCIHPASMFTSNPRLLLSPQLFPLSILFSHWLLHLPSSPSFPLLLSFFCWSASLDSFGSYSAPSLLYFFSSIVFL